jgi:hypothetical protein
MGIFGRNINPLDYTNFTGYKTLTKSNKIEPKQLSQNDIMPFDSYGDTTIAINKIGTPETVTNQSDGNLIHTFTSDAILNNYYISGVPAAGTLTFLRALITIYRGNSTIFTAAGHMNTTNSLNICAPITNFLVKEGDVLYLTYTRTGVNAEYRLQIGFNFVNI